MAKKNTPKDRPAPAPAPIVAAPKGPSILVEDPNGGAPYEVPTRVELHPRDPNVTVEGYGRFVHVSDVGDRWVYRPVTK